MKNIFFLIIFIPIALFSQQQESLEEKQKDLKVGLVLSGGGAKGLAHVGVLKVLEQAGVRIDYIGGTSMGAIIGSLYASGYSAVQLDSIVHSIDFTRILSDELPRKSIPFYEKENGEKYAFTLPVYGKKIGLPKALSKGQNVLNLLSKLTQHVNTMNDFSKLPIPFFCMSTNLENGNQEILNSGFLPEAVRASGAFPTLLEPVEIDGKLMADGGIVNNFPIDEMLAMGVDIVIGVDVQGRLSKKEELTSAVEIVNQIVSFQMYQDNSKKNRKVDVYMHPNIEDFSVVSFDKIDVIIEEGRVAAQNKIRELIKIGEQQIAKKEKKVNFSKQENLLIKGILLSGNENYTRSYVKGKLDIKTNEIISYEKFLQGIDNLSATGNFQNIKYKFLENDIVEFQVVESNAPSKINLSAHYDNLYKTSALLNFTTKHLISKNDIFSIDFIVGDNLRYDFNYFIDNGHNWSYGVKSNFNSFNATLSFNPQNITKENIFYRDFTNQVYLQTVFDRKYALGIGIEQKQIRTYTEEVDNFGESNRNYLDNSNYGNFISYLKIDTYDKPYFEKSGSHVDIDFKWYLFSSKLKRNFNSFSQLKGEFGYAHTVLDKLTFHFLTQAGFTIGTNQNQVLNYSLGGYGENYINNFIPFFGYDIADLNDTSFLKTGVDIRYEVFPKNYITGAVNVARVTNDLFNQGSIFEDTKIGYALGYGLETFFGPIQLNYTWSPEINDNWYFNLGFWF